MSTFKQLTHALKKGYRLIEKDKINGTDEHKMVLNSLLVKFKSLEQKVKVWKEKKRHMLILIFIC